MNYQISRNFNFPYNQYKTSETISFSYDNCPFSMDGSLLSDSASNMPASCYLSIEENIFKIIKNTFYHFLLHVLKLPHNDIQFYHYTKNLKNFFSILIWKYKNNIKDLITILNLFLYRNCLKVHDFSLYIQSFCPIFSSQHTVSLYLTSFATCK